MRSSIPAHPSSTGLPVDSTQNTPSSDISLPTNKLPDRLPSAMRPHLDSEPGLKPDELPPVAKLEAGYIRYIRMLLTPRLDGEVSFETCIRRARSDDDIDPSRDQGSFFYTAISYAWGDPTPFRSIVLDGHKRLVAQNLWHFLQRTRAQRTFLHRVTPFIGRDSWPEHWLWIDALCISQSDARERAQQIGIMSEIFGRADQVISWLGLACNTSEHAMTTITGHASDGYVIEQPTISQRDLSEAICSLCERPYWKRLWVFQELRHAQHILLACGNQTITWRQFTALRNATVRITVRYPTISERMKQNMATRMITLRTRPSIDDTLWGLLKETENLVCADPRDRVYALLSVATGGHEGIEADYSREQHHNTPLDLAHRTLRNHYALQPPRALADISADCTFLTTAFGMSQDAIVMYGRHRHVDRDQWYRNELQYLYDKSFPISRAGILHANNCSYAVTEYTNEKPAWSAWAEFHGYTTVTALFQNSK
jgi:hypothetical protein